MPNCPYVQKYATPRPIMCINNLCTKLRELNVCDYSPIWHIHLYIYMQYIHKLDFFIYFEIYIEKCIQQNPFFKEYETVV